MKTLAALLALALVSCAAPAYVISSDDGVHTIRARSTASLNPAGPGIAWGLSDRADVQCPKGWNQLEETITKRPNHYVVEWRVRCL